jgi:hypothetical protein
MNKKLVFILLSLFVVSIVNAQFEPVLICSTNVNDATGYNNSHKIAMRQELGDTVHIVFYSNDSVKYVRSCDRGFSWEPIRNVAKGLYPAIDIDQRGYRHVVYEVFDTTNHTYEVYYYCLDIRSPPRNISETPGNSVNPAIVVDQNNVAHIVWSDNTYGQYRIYYRSYDLMTLSDTFQVSTIGTEAAVHSYPSIAIYQPNNRIYIIWQYYDSLCYTPYQIYSRYQESEVWQDISSMQGHWYPLRAPSLDYSHGEDELSACWQDSSSGNMEAHFYGGNGGGYNTPGYSATPVLSTIGGTWSYLFWQDGDDDIFYHLFYFMQGWTSGTFHQRFHISEPMYYPNCTGCYCIWTQGDTQPYELYFCEFGYPIGIAETEHHLLPVKTQPNPSSGLVNLLYILPSVSNVKVEIFNLHGKKVKTILSSRQNQGEHKLVWNSTDDLGRKVPSGVYLCRLEYGGQQRIKKVVIDQNK